MSNTNRPDHQGTQNVVSLFESGRMNTIWVITTSVWVGKEWINNLPANEIRKIFSYLEEDTNPTDKKLRIIENLIPHFAMNYDLFDKIIHNTPEFKKNRDNELREPIHTLTQNMLVILFEWNDPISFNPEYVNRMKLMTRIWGFRIDTFSHALIRIFPEKYKNMSTEEISKLFRTIYNYSEKPSSKALSANVSPGYITIMSNTADNTSNIINDPIGPNDNTNV